MDYAKAAQSIAKLRSLVDDRKAAITAVEKIDDKIAKAVLEADDAGVQIAGIADVLGLSRQSTYRILLRVRPKDDDAATG